MSPGRWTPDQGGQGPTLTSRAQPGDSYVSGGGITSEAETLQSGSPAPPNPTPAIQKGS